MRIDRLTLKNFRKFEDLTLDLHPRFTLLVGINGSGKSTILDALAIGLEPLPIQVLRLLQKNALDLGFRSNDPRLSSKMVGDRTQFQEERPVSIFLEGQFQNRDKLEWVMQYDQPGNWIESTIFDKIRELLLSAVQDSHVSLPILGHWLSTRAARVQGDGSVSISTHKPSRLDAYLNCFTSRHGYTEVKTFFYRETAAMGARGGKRRPGLEAVRRAVLNCLPGADDLWFDVDFADLVCSIDGQAQPLNNLSDGQRMLLAMVADIAIRAVTLNAHLLPPDELGPEDEPLPRVLRETPGIVLIDELDAHLHPSWQRRVAANLKETFPAIQFVCTTHSPQVIGEVPKEEIRIIDGNHVYSPEHSYGVDSSRILEEIMDTPPRTKEINDLLAKLARQIDDDDFDGARATIQKAAEKLGEDDPEITRARTLMAFVEPSA